jgi:hypothetical protein
MVTKKGFNVLCTIPTRPEESYRVSNSVLLRNLKGEGQDPIWAVELLDGWVDALYRYSPRRTIRNQT